MVLLNPFVKSMKSLKMQVQAKRSAARIKIWPLIKKNILNILRWGSIGVGIGAVPGVGENIAAWVAYDDAKRRYKGNKKFGTGVYEGVMAPETANNAAIGGAVIPLISLGIPGSPPPVRRLGRAFPGLIMGTPMPPKAP